MKAKAPVNLPGYNGSFSWMKLNRDEIIEQTKMQNSQEVSRQVDQLADHKAMLEINLSRLEDRLATAELQFANNNPHCDIREEYIATHQNETNTSQLQQRSTENFQEKKIGVGLELNKQGLDPKLYVNLEVGNRASQLVQDNVENINKSDSAQRMTLSENANCSVEKNTNSDFSKVVDAKNNYQNAKSELNKLTAREEAYQDYVNYLNNSLDSTGKLSFQNADGNQMTIHLVDKNGVAVNPGEYPRENLILMYQEHRKGFLSNDTFQLDADGVLDRDIPTLDTVLNLQHPIAEHQKSSPQQNAKLEPSIDHDLSVKNIPEKNEAQPTTDHTRSVYSNEAEIQERLRRYGILKNIEENKNQLNHHPKLDDDDIGLG